MDERIKVIQQNVLNWWNKFTPKQKTLIVSVVVGVAIALGTLYAVLSQPTMVTLVTCESAKEASEIKTLLDAEGISNTTSNDGLVIQVDKKVESAAVLLLGANSIPTKAYDLTTVFDGSFSTTEADKSKKYQLYLEEKIGSQLKSIDIVEEATVQLSIPNNDGTLISQKESTYASILVTLSSTVEEGVADGWAKYIATAVGNKSTENILILDSNGNVLFTGDESSSTAGMANNQLAVQTKVEGIVKSQVRDLMLGTNVYNNVEIGLNLVLDFNVIEETDHQYYVEDGNTQGYLNSESNYEQESEGGLAATPGADANDDVTYVIGEGGISRSTTIENTKDYLPNEKIINTQFATGTIKPEESSITLVANTYKVYDEDKMKESGELAADETFAQFQAANSEKIKIDVDEELFQVVSKATGIEEENISIIAYEVPFFQESTTAERTIWDYLQIVLIVVILGLLGFVVFKSTRREKEIKMEPELSVENLLETTKVAQREDELEDIGFSEKSEVRLLIEKFVDENPEAVAHLLRNWLNEEWES